MTRRQTNIQYIRMMRDGGWVPHLHLERIKFNRRGDFSDVVEMIDDRFDLEMQYLHYHPDDDLTFTEDGLLNALIISERYSEKVERERLQNLLVFKPSVSGIYQKTIENVEDAYYIVQNTPHPLRIRIQYFRGGNYRFATINTSELAALDNGETIDRSGGISDDMVVNYSLQYIQATGNCNCKKTNRNIKINNFECTSYYNEYEGQCLLSTIIGFLNDSSKKQIRVKRDELIKTLSISNKNMNIMDCTKICKHFRINFQIVIITDKQEVIENIFDPSYPTIHLLNFNNHYYKINNPFEISSKKLVEESSERGITAPTHPADVEIIYDDDTNDFSDLVQKILTSNKNVISSCAGGMGKSYLIAKIEEELLRKGCKSNTGEFIERSEYFEMLNSSKFCICALTGAACITLKNRTISDVITLALLKYRIKVLKSLSYLIIDEMSMMHPEDLDFIKKINPRLRVMMFGDFYQAPPVKSDEGYLFQSDSYIPNEYLHVVLTKVRRTSNVDFARTCIKVRKGDYSDPLLRKLFANSQDEIDEMGEVPSEDYLFSQCMKYDMIIATTNEICDKLNALKLDSMKGEYIDIPSTFLIIKEKLPSLLRREEPVSYLRTKLNSTVMITKNNRELGVVNGDIGTLISISEDRYFNILIKRTQNVIRTTYYDDTKKELIKDPKDPKKSKEVITYREILPFTNAYCITVHKSQGSSYNFDYGFYTETNYFIPELFYVGISRATDPNFVHLIGSYSNLIEKLKKCKRNKFLDRFEKYEKVYTNSKEKEIKSMTFELEDRIQDKVLTYKELKSVDPSSIIYFDFETFVRFENVHDAYSSQMIISRKTEEFGFRDDERIFISDIPTKELITDSERVKGVLMDSSVSVINQTVELIIEEIKIFIKSHNISSYNKKIFYNMLKECPVLCGFNISGFDLLLLVKPLENHPFFTSDPSKKFNFSTIVKSGAIVSFNISVNSYPVLKTHDMYQILNCSLKSACEFYLSERLDCRKIDFHDEIIYLAKNRKNITDFTKEIVFDIKTYSPDYEYSRYSTTSQKSFIPLSVIEYGMKDVEVLPHLYRKISNFVKTIYNNDSLSIFNFLTAGQMSWYGTITNLPKKISEKSDSHHKDNEILTNLYTLNREKTNFIMETIIGGRACPRLQKNIPGTKYQYVDICGMYSYILNNCKFPEGKCKFYKEENNLNIIYETLINYSKKFKEVSEIPIDDFPLMGFADCEICDCSKLESTFPLKTKNGTKYINTQQRRILTYLDIILCLVRGGKLFSLYRALQFESSDKYMSKWTDITIKGKTDYKKSNPGLSTFYKLLGNSSYGQTLRKERDDVISMCSNEEELKIFLKDNNFRYFIGMEKFDIIFGSSKLENASKKISRRIQYCGSYVLAYSRLMLLSIIDTINPDDIRELQPITGDTDSLVITVQQAEILRNKSARKDKIPYFPSYDVPGCLTDELRDIVSKKQSSLMKKYNLKEFVLGKDAIIDEIVAPAPKIVALKYHISINGKDFHFCKMRLKGVSMNAYITDDEVLSPKIIFDAVYDKKKISCLMPDTLKCTSFSMYSSMHPETVCTIQSQKQMIRNVLQKKWTGKYLEDEMFFRPFRSEDELKKYLI